MNKVLTVKDLKDFLKNNNIDDDFQIFIKADVSPILEGFGISQITACSFEVDSAHIDRVNSKIKICASIG